MTAPVFADTNLLVYSRDARDAAKQARAAEWLDLLWHTRRGYWLSPIEPGVLVEAAWALQDRCSLSFWDSLIVGAAQTMGCGFVLTEDLPAGQDLEGVRIVNPFETRPADLRD